MCSSAGRVACASTAPARARRIALFGIVDLAGVALPQVQPSRRNYIARPPTEQFARATLHMASTEL
jgi:hypothetical protein